MTDKDYSFWRGRKDTVLLHRTFYPTCRDVQYCEDDPTMVRGVSVDLGTIWNAKESHEYAISIGRSVSETRGVKVKVLDLLEEESRNNELLFPLTLHPDPIKGTCSIAGNPSHALLIGWVPLPDGSTSKSKVKRLIDKVYCRTACFLADHSKVAYPEPVT